jgi:hypothetical protein
LVYIREVKMVLVQLELALFPGETPPTVNVGVDVPNGSVGYVRRGSENGVEYEEAGISASLGADLNILVPENEPV